MKHVQRLAFPLSIVCVFALSGVAVAGVEDIAPVVKRLLKQLGILNAAGVYVPSSVTFPLRGPNGTVAAPSYAFSPSTGTGLYSTGSNALALATNGIAGLAIDSSQNVTIEGSAGDASGGGLLTLPTGGALQFNARSRIQSAGDGSLVLWDHTATTFTELQFGGTSSSFPEIRRNGTAFNFRLADNSGDCAITASAGTFSGNLALASGSAITWATDGSFSRAGAAGVVQLVNPNSLTSSTALRVYNTTDAATGAPTNAEWLETAWATNACTIQTVKGGTGTTRALSFNNVKTIDAGVNGGVTVATNGTGVFFIDANNGGACVGQYAIRFGSTPASFDATISRAAAGSLQVGTTANNALGTLSCATVIAGLNAGNGTSGSPSVCFNGNTDRGLFNDTTNTGIGFSVGGGQKAVLTTTVFQLFSGVNVTFGGKINNYNGVNTAGEGVADIRAQANVTAQSSNATITSYANPAADGDYEVSAEMNVTASTTLTTTLTCTYTDVTSSARTMILPVTAENGTMVASGAISGAGATRWETPVMHIRAKASTTITILTAAGTFTGVTYSASGVIKKTS